MVPRKVRSSISLFVLAMVKKSQRDFFNLGTTKNRVLQEVNKKIEIFLTDWLRI